MTEPTNDIEAGWQRRLASAYALLEANVTRAERGNHCLGEMLDRLVGPANPKVTRIPLRHPLTDPRIGPALPPPGAQRPPAQRQSADPVVRSTRTPYLTRLVWDDRPDPDCPPRAS